MMSTLMGFPYYGNTRSRNVPRRHVIAQYYAKNNWIDVHNQSRQFDLRLEKHWVTEDGFFRDITTVFGICVTDCWLAYKHQLHVNHWHKNMSLMDYVSLLCCDMLENKFSSIITEDALEIHVRNWTPCTGMEVPVSLPNQNTEVSSLTDSVYGICVQHPLLQTKEMKAYSNRDRATSTVKTGVRSARGTCIICKRKRSRFYCAGCPLIPGRLHPWICSPIGGDRCSNLPPSKRPCLEIHHDDLKKEAKAKCEYTTM